MYRIFFGLRTVVLLPIIELVFFMPQHVRFLRWGCESLLEIHSLFFTFSRFTEGLEKPAGFDTSRASLDGRVEHRPFDMWFFLDLGFSRSV